MSRRPPVKDWATDFDHLDPRWVNDPFPIWDEMRKRARSRIPTASWACTSPRATRTCARWPTTRSISPRAASSCARRRRRAFRRRPSPPIRPSTGRRAWCCCRPSRPTPIKKLEPRARALCNELIDKFIATRHCDAAVEYAQEIPVRVIAHMLGLPESDGDLYRKWIKMILEDGITDISVADPGRRRDDALLHGPRARAHGKARRRPDQLLERRKFNGEPLSLENVIGSLRLLLIAGIDTTWSGIGSCIWHLATTSRGPPAAGAGALADADGHRGIPARLCARHHGARGGQGDGDQRLHVQAGRDGAAVVPGRQPRSRRCSRTPTR